MVEDNAAQRYIVQLLQGTVVPVIGVRTGRSKTHPEYGIEGMAVELAAGRWTIPSKSGKAEPEVADWVSEMLFYDPRNHTGDRLMASWFAREGARRLAEKPEFPFPATLTSLSRAAQAALRRALDAFGRSDADLARRVLDEDDEIDGQHDEVIRTLVHRLEEGSGGVSQNVDAIQLAKHLERVADHATNIAEDVILVAEARNVKHEAKLAR